MTDPREIALANSTRRMNWSVTETGSLRLYQYLIATRSGFCVSTKSHELNYVLQGELNLAVGPRKQHIRLGPGQSCVVTRGTPHQLTIAKNTTFAIVDLQTLPITQQGLVPISHMTKRAQAILESIPHTGTSIGAKQTRRLYSEVAPPIARNPVLQVELGHNTKHMFGVKRDLENSYQLPISIKEYAKGRGMDPHYLMRAFKKNFLATPYSYVQFLRKEHFVWELLRPEPMTANLLDQASAAGFGDYATLCRNFSREFGKPPSQLVSSRE